jgi:iron(III) transport system ATP-binding protein
MTDDAFLRCEGVSKRFGVVRAVDGVSLGLQQGRVLALLGPSGCGKTTLLRMIAGFEASDAGEIALAGRVLNSASRFVLPEQRRVGMVFQDFALFPHLNVAANVGFALKRGDERKQRVGQLLELVGLQGLESRMPHQLSGGQRQRVALARALAADPQLLLLDEPFSNLDPSTRLRVRAEVKQLIQTVGITALFVTHDQEEALSLADEVGVMSSGQLLQIGTPDEIYTSPVSREVGEFIGVTMFLPGEASGGSVECELGRLQTIGSATGPVDVMLRAESLTLAEGGTPAVVRTVEYFGHDQLVTVRLASGTELRVRLPATARLTRGESVGLGVKGDVVVFPRA